MNENTDAVERAARAVAEEMTRDADYDPAYDYTEDSRRYARAALAAARVGEAECRTQCDADCDTPCHEDHQVPAKREHDPDHCPGAIAEVLRLRRLLAAQRGGEPVNRGTLTDAALVDLYWSAAGDGWAIPEAVMVKFGRAVLAAQEQS